MPKPTPEKLQEQADTRLLKRVMTPRFYRLLRDRKELVFYSTRVKGREYLLVHGSWRIYARASRADDWEPLCIEPGDGVERTEIQKFAAAFLVMGSDEDQFLASTNLWNHQDDPEWEWYRKCAELWLEEGVDPKEVRYYPDPPDYIYEEERRMPPRPWYWWLNPRNLWRELAW